MGVGVSLHVGVNRTNPFALGARAFATLSGCDLAAHAMADIAATRGFGRTLTLVDEAATRAEVVGWLETAATTCRADDLVFFSFAGHGTRAPHRDDADSAWRHAFVLHDGKLVDAELLRILERFQAGVRVVIVADCCAGGPVAESGAHVEADVLVLAATTDAAKTPGAPAAGALPPFSRALVDAWRVRSGDFPGGYLELWGLIGGTSQLHPRLVRDEDFLREQPLRIERATRYQFNGSGKNSSTSSS